MEEQIIADGIRLSAVKFEFSGVNILLLKNENGCGLGCGYLNLAAADKFGHVLATVSGVNNWEEMLAARVNGVSKAAEKIGITTGISGLEALKLMDKADICGNGAL